MAIKLIILMSHYLTTHFLALSSFYKRKVMKMSLKMPLKLAAIIFIYISLINNTAFSQNLDNSNVFPLENSTTNSDQKEGLFYLVENLDKTKKLLLIGSSHYGYTVLNEVGEKLKNTVGKLCEEFADETTPGTPTEESISNIRKNVDLAGSVLLDSEINKIHEIYKKKYGTSLKLLNAEYPDDVKNSRLLAVVATLIGSIDVYGMPAPVGISIDQIFKNIAIDLGKKISALENPSSLATIYSSISSDDYVKMVRGLLLLADDRARQKILAFHGTRSINFSAQGNADLVREEFINSFVKSTNIDERIILKFFFERDLPISEKIIEFLEKKNNYCVAVGATHLGGETGILKRLEAQKYTIRQLKIK